MIRKRKFDFILQGNLVANPSTFPSGVKALADYVHGKGLKLGVYGDAGYAYLKTTKLQPCRTEKISLAEIKAQ
jgi:hypothetical protein